jgi:hypothetical protein
MTQSTTRRSPYESGDLRDKATDQFNRAADQAGDMASRLFASLK